MTNVPLEVTTPFGAGKLILRNVQGEEGISKLFRFTLQMESDDGALDFTKIVGKAVTVTMTLPGGAKTYRNGIVGRFTQAGKNARGTTYTAEMHPWTWLLTLNSDCHIYQNKSVPDILKAIFGDLGFSDFTNSLKGSYQPREYCVQYNETTFEFISRLMEEEGIFYFFTHTSSGHKMVLADDASAFAACAEISAASIPGTFAAGWESIATIQSCTVEQNVVVGKYKTTDYNFETPSTALLGTASGKQSTPAMYEYPGNHKTQGDGQKIAGRVLNELEAPARLLRGNSNCRSFGAGLKFKVEKHSRSDINDSWVIKTLNWHADLDAAYGNSFEAFPAATAFRPPRVTKKPRISGIQTAIVTGKSGEEIFTDQYGRIKVQFYWDQLGKNDENSSCWIRVAHFWAGKQWGSFFLPRVGQEVVVTFLEGNPDRPLVTGSVYNATQTVPYGLPGEQTKSTIKSHSSKQGSGFNEFRFEDKKDSEEIFLQAQKDLNIKVLHDETRTVTNARTTTISKKDDTLTVSEGNRVISVSKGNETHSVKGTRDLTVTGDETVTDKANFTQKVTKNYTLKVDGDISIEATGNVTIKAGKAFTNQSGTDFTNKAGTTLTNQAGTELTNKAGTNLTNKAGVNLENNAGVQLTNKGSATQTVDGGGMLTVKGGMVKIN
jgi:type VI secretion system secreted protein VgrG